VNSQSILIRVLPWLVVGSLTFVACDKGDAKSDDKKDDKALAKTAGDAKTDEVKGDPKADEVKADPKAHDAKADAGADDTVGPDAKADDVKADDAKADDAKADDAKADDAKADDKKADDKKPDDKKPDDAKADPGSKVNAAELFGKKCKSCHGASGDAKTKIGAEQKIADWTQPGWKAKWSKGKIIDIVTNGKAGTKMKPFKDKLSTEEIAALADYSRKLGK